MWGHRRRSGPSGGGRVDGHHHTLLLVGFFMTVVMLWPLPGDARILERHRERRYESTHGLIYLDLGYSLSSTEPANHAWRSKGTTSVLDRVEFNNATIGLANEAAPDSRFGFEVGVQTGIDPDSGVPDENAVGGASTLKHLYYTNLSYLFPLGRGLELTGGLIPGFPGYPSFHAIENPSYTRHYGVDYVPYFLWGVRATYPFTERLAASVFVVTGWDYLVDANDVPSYGLQFRWQATERAIITQNLYYGSDQAATAVDYWRFVSNTVAEWRFGSFLLAGSFTYGTERQAELPGEPRFGWTAGALWVQWMATQNLRFALRPEFFDDPNGLMTGARQTLSAVAVTAEYRLSPIEWNTVSARAEIRLDRSTGDEGGFYEGPDNSLVPDQQLLIVALMWKFNSADE